MASGFRTCARSIWAMRCSVASRWPKRCSQRARIFCLSCKKDGHKTLYEYVEGAPLDQRTVTERKPGKRSLTYRYRWIDGVPLRDGKDALNVNWLGVAITDETGKTTYDGAFVTSLPLTADNVVEVAACARARWKIENESFNVLKNNGYNLAHNFGHGKKYLARTFAAMNLLAFAFHTACDCLETLWQQAREAVGARCTLLSGPAHHHGLRPVSLMA